MTDLIALARKCGATWGVEPDSLVITTDQLRAFADAIVAGQRENAKRYEYLRGRSVKDGRNGGWTGSFVIFPVPGWDDTPYAKNIGQGFHHDTLDEAIDAAIRTSDSGKGDVR